MDKTPVLDAFQAAHDEYFRILLKSYPLIQKDTPFEDFGPTELLDLAIEVHSCAVALGPKARDRLFYLGLDLLYPFDNPVDLYNWRQRVKKENIDHSTYAAIAIRIDSEIKRMRRILALGAEASYESLPVESFLVSRTRYEGLKTLDKQSESSDRPPPPSSPQYTTHIDTVTINYAADSQAVSHLEKLEKETTITSNLVSILRGIFGQ